MRPHRFRASERHFFPVDDQSPDTPNAGLDCDDWCHAWVSPVALTRNIVPDVFIPTIISGGGTYTLSYSSLPIPPVPSSYRLIPYDTRAPWRDASETTVRLSPVG